ncbi:hypothetical protein GGP41_006129 [Bipolaris sorokiniana]|uniref:40S ribosomal protein S25 n=1 Tax=Cochliobolus sativus TaxID=45130 RepID=A0A8H5ZHD3_COCSA|nr:hypothetical protein GGP41_006129 [Bipolaris sorokiniana]
MGRRIISRDHIARLTADLARQDRAPDTKLVSAQLVGLSSATTHIRQNATGGKKQKKKWSKGKVKDKAQHAVVLDKTTNDKLQKDVQSYRLITVATLVDRLKINGSLARKALADLEANGQIKKVVGHSKLSIYTRAIGDAE